MKKFLAAAAFAVALSLTGFMSATPASAASAATVSTEHGASQSTDISARRYRRYGYRPYYARRYYAPRYYAPRYYAPRPYYGGYGYGYRRPGVYFGF